jgi:predicted short-subunit dehydrogenase-like oxidoreductase (DUF2520 family)
MLPRKWYIAGTGNLGISLGHLLQHSKNIEFGGWLSRNPSAVGVSPAFDLEIHADADAGIFLCIPDRFLESAATSLRQRFSKIVHCSGMQPLFDTCDAVCWPMQTFSSQVPSVWKEVPVFIETKTQELHYWLKDCFEAVGARPVYCQLKDRQTAHLAAVIANNFSNAMFKFAEDVMITQNLNPELLLPIIRQTVEKLNHSDAQNNQTGPAIRHDLNTIELQTEMLKANPHLQRLYHEISIAIPFLFKK